MCQICFYIDVVQEATECVKKAKKKKKKKEKLKQQENSDSDKEISHKSPVPNANVGQWGTAELGDANRQKKFFALLGGFKKATTDSYDLKESTNSNSTAAKPFAAKFNAALNKKRESELNSKLERQFEQARFTQLNARGLGLGFSEPKKNAIDINASRSKKFAD